MRRSPHDPESELIAKRALAALEKEIGQVRAEEDDLGRAVLESMLNEPWTKNAALARALKVNQSTVSRRKQEIREKLARRLRRTERP